MPTDVLPAENVAAPVVSTEGSQNYADVMKSMTPAELTDFALNGNEPERLKQTAAPVKEVAKEEPSPVKAKAVPVEGAEEGDEPEYFGTADQQRTQRHAFARLKRERAELKAENKLLREQKTEVKPAAPVAALKAEVEAKPAIERPKRPRLTDPKYAVDSGGELYDADMDAYEEKLEAFNGQRTAQERQKDAEQSARLEGSKHWAQEIADSEKLHPDFKEVAFSAKVPASLPMIGVLMGMKGGAECFYHFGSHPDESAELAKDTDFPGYASYDALISAAAKDPALARQVGMAEGIVRAEAKRILAGTKKPAEPTTVKTTKAPAPGTRVHANSATGGDPIEDAYARGDHALGAKLEAERDVERYTKR